VDTQTVYKLAQPLAGDVQYADDMLLAIGIILAIAWVIGYLVYHVASFGIHLLLIGAVVAGIVYLVRRGSAHAHSGRHSHGLRV
jgi:hypothetical protein